MRIAFVTAFYNPSMGGVQMHIEHLANQFVAQGHEVEVLTHIHEPGLPPEVNARGVQIRRFPVVGNFAHYALSPALVRYVRANQHRFDLIHGHNYHSSPPALVARRTSGPFVFTPHYHGVGGSAVRGVLHKPFRFVAQRIVDRASTVIAVGPAEAELFEQHFPRARGKVVVIPNGVDSDGISAAEPFDEDGRTVILAAGRLDDYKRVDHTIRALAHLGDDYVLRITGAGPAREPWEALVAELGVQDRVRFLGIVSIQDLYRWYQTASVYVTMSEIEAMGMAALEALYAGARVVASDIPAHRGTATYAGERMRLVPQGTPSEELAQAIAAMAASDPPHGAVPTWRQVADRTMEVYAAALDGRPADPAGAAGVVTAAP